MDCRFYHLKADKKMIVNWFRPAAISEVIENVQDTFHVIFPFPVIIRK